MWSPSTLNLAGRANSHPASHLVLRDECASSGATSPIRNRSDARSTGVDAVIHLAAIIPPATDRVPDLARKVNVDGTRNLIAQMESSATAKRLVFASSVGIFGDIQDRDATAAC